MKSEFVDIIPILPSSNIKRDVEWYVKTLGFNLLSATDSYAILNIGKLFLHLQFYEDELNKRYINKSAVKIFVNNIEPIFKQCVDAGLVTAQKLRIRTPWNTNEFGFYDLNKNSIVIAEDLNEYE